MAAYIDIIAYTLLMRDDIADLRATHDAIELADILINTETEMIIPDNIDIPELRAIMTEMILNPID